ncbi:MAG: sigma-54-dependent transcriptional regulator [Alphaproteobacteria bacterium]
MIDGRPDVLLVEDEPALAHLYDRAMASRGWSVVLAASGAAAREALASRPRLVVLDLNLPDMDGIELLREIAAGGAAAPLVIVVTARGSLRTAVDAMRAGAHDFLAKPIAIERFATTVRNALDRRRLDGIVEQLTADAGSALGGMIGRSPAIRAVYRMATNVAHSRAPVLITGESGTGKELCAEAIHGLGPRAGQPFVAINCGAIPKGLAESELFGHVRGAFTGATADREGAVARARGGTLFLDELGELELDVQSKLLRFAQSMTFRRVGDDSDRTTDLRLIGATNKHLPEEIAGGRFREDLFYRVAVLSIDLPPLRERGDDVVEIARHFLARYGREEGKRFEGFTADAEALLLAHRWPGNVRQLRNVVWNLAVLAPSGWVSAAMIEPLLRGTPNGVEPGAAAEVPRSPDAAEAHRRIRPIADLEREAIAEAIEAFDGNYTQAARALGISVATIYRKHRRT